MKYSLTFFSLCLLVVMPGCSGGPSDTPDIGNVSGHIKVDKQPKAGLQVRFQPDDGRLSSGTTDDSGYYELKYSMTEDGAKVGKGLMTISSPPPEGGCCGELPEGYEDPIPPQFNSNAANNPDMHKEVKPGDNTFDFDIDTSIRGEAPPSDCGGGSSCCCG